MVKITQHHVKLETEEEDKELVNELKENLKRDSNKMFVKECIMSTKNLF